MMGKMLLRKDIKYVSGISIDRMIEIECEWMIHAREFNEWKRVPYDSESDFRCYVAYRVLLLRNRFVHISPNGKKWETKKRHIKKMRSLYDRQMPGRVCSSIRQIKILRFVVYLINQHGKRIKILQVDR